MVQTVAHVVGCRYSSVDLSAPSIVPPGFESQAHYLCFHQFIELSNVEKTKLNRKEAGIGTLFKNNKNCGTCYKEIIVTHTLLAKVCL